MSNEAHRINRFWLLTFDRVVNVAQVFYELRETKDRKEDKREKRKRKIEKKD
jgi:hypothetical protein